MVFPRKIPSHLIRRLCTDDMPIIQGEQVTVLMLPSPGGHVVLAAAGHSAAYFLWTGAITHVDFPMRVAPDAAPGPHECRAQVIVGQRIREISFVIVITAAGVTTRAADDAAAGGAWVTTGVVVIFPDVPLLDAVDLRDLVLLGGSGGHHGDIARAKWRGKEVVVKYPKLGRADAELAFKHEAAVQCVPSRAAHAHLMRLGVRFGLLA